MGSRNICTICQEVFLFQVDDKDEQPYALKCGHVFHNKCLSQWKANVNKCPQCRAPAQNPIRLFFISDSDTNREDLDVYMLQAELEREKSKNQEIKKKYNETCNKLETVKEKSKTLEMHNAELKHIVPSLQDSIKNLRKENKESFQSITNLENEIKEHQAKLKSYANIKIILDESVESIDINRYKNMKPDQIGNIVNQWKKNANYYRQLNLSDMTKYKQVQDDLRKYKEKALMYKEELVKTKQEVNILRSIAKKKNTVGSQGLDSTSLPSVLNSEDEFDLLVTPSGTNAMNQQKRLNVSAIDDSPLVKKMKITNVLAINKKPPMSSHTSEPSISQQKLSSSDSFNPKPTSFFQSVGSGNSRLLKPLPTNKPFQSNLSGKSAFNSTGTKTSSTSLFKKTHSFKSSRDIINYFDK